MLKVAKVHSSPPEVNAKIYFNTPPGGEWENILQFTSGGEYILGSTAAPYIPPGGERENILQFTSGGEHILGSTAAPYIPAGTL